MQVYYPFRDELTVEDDFIYKGLRLLVPMSLRREIKEKLHAAHMAIESCLRRARKCVFWPRMNAELKDYTTRCEVCQKHSPSLQRETLVPHPEPKYPGERVGGDIFEHKGNNFLVTVDYFSNYWETTSPYHPMANGLVERLNGTLKKMLRRMCTEQPKEWDRFIEPLLFAYREVSQELRTGDKLEEETKMAYQYGIDLRERLETTCQMAHEALEEAGERYKRYYDRGSKSRALKVGGQVLLLLPTEHNKLTTKWKGPYVVKGKRGEVDYVVDVEGNPKTFHVNMLKKYFSRVPETDSHVPVVAGVASNIDDGALVWPLGEQADHCDVAASEKLTPPQAQELRSLISST
ncbi:uncharacterized protein LOC144129452 [Amblyomma americanum]